MARVDYHNVWDVLTPFFSVLASSVRTKVKDELFTVFEGNGESEGELAGFNGALVVQLLNRRPMFIDEISGHVHHCSLVARFSKQIFLFCLFVCSFTYIATLFGV